MFLVIGAVVLGSSLQSASDPDDPRYAFYANGRIRAETIQQPPNGPDRSRGRLRFRIGGSYEISETLRAEARISSLSDGDANNPHWDFGDGAEGLAGADLVLDRLFVRWTPDEAVSLLAGRFPDLFRRPPVFGEFVWDADLSPAGAGAVFAPGDQAFDVRVMAGVVQENPAGDDATFVAVQANYATDPSRSTTAHFASSFERWYDADQGIFQNQGNTSLAGDFEISNTLVEVTHDGGVMGRQKVYGQYVHNFGDVTGADTAITAGCEIGLDRPGQTMLLFAFYDFDANALFSPVAQDLTPVAGTGIGMGMDGFLAGFRYRINPDATVRVLLLTTDVGLDDDPYRFVVDLDFNML